LNLWCVGFGCESDLKQGSLVENIGKHWETDRSYNQCWCNLCSLVILLTLR